VMLLRNHGLLVAGKSIPEAFDLIYYLERACQIQVRMQSTGVPLVQPGENVAKQVSQMFVRPDREAAQKAWIAMLRMLDSTDPSFRS
jgi:ribulose-5-phosphate 4-epimerase/fuculose-1-phosphate aldolase